MPSAPARTVICLRRRRRARRRAASPRRESARAAARGERTGERKDFQPQIEPMRDVGCRIDDRFQMTRKFFAHDRMDSARVVPFLVEVAFELLRAQRDRARPPFHRANAAGLLPSRDARAEERGRSARHETLPLENSHVPVGLRLEPDVVREKRRGEQRDRDQEALHAGDYVRRARVHWCTLTAARRSDAS